jgi:pantoate kinase
LTPFLTTKSTYWVASHITGIFEILKNSNDLLFQGSRGAGFCIDRGVNTTVLRDMNQENLNIHFNNSLVDIKKADISMYILKNLVSSKDMKQLSIYHNFEVPIEAGFGASAAGGLGLAFAINSTFNLKKHELFLWHLAHKAEIVCSGGLGDILGLYQGGTEIRLNPGAPNIGKTTSFKMLDKKNKLVTISLGKIPTKHIITSVEKQGIISKSSNNLLKLIDSSTSFKEFLTLSSKFSNDIQLYSTKLKNLIFELSTHGITCAQIMLGEGLFFVIPNEMNIKKILNNLGILDNQYAIETICSKTVKKIV